jgi:hypothetical protein
MGFETQYALKIDPVGLTGALATAYDHEVRRHLGWIAGTTVGQLVLRGIAWHARHNPSHLKDGVVPIVPYTGDYCNAKTDQATHNATGYMQPTVRYSPGVFHKGGLCYADSLKKDTNRGLTPDEMLFHELVHAFRGASARDSGITGPLTGGLAGYDDEEEFIAVLMTNIYISDPSNTSKTGLRKDHATHEPLEPGLAGSFAFYKSSKDVFTYIDALCTENPALTKWVADVKAPFNPIAAYYKDKAACQRNSNSTTAKLRDGDWQGLMDDFLQSMAPPPVFVRPTL